MPIMPRIEVARPTVCGGMPRPPVKVNGRDWGGELGSLGL